MGRPKQKESKTKLISIRVTEKEFAFIEKKAFSSALTVSSYLRALGMNYPIRSRVDFLAVDNLIQSKVELARIGGLFKMWLSRGNSTLGSKSHKDIELIINDLDKKQNEILEISKVILSGYCNQKNYSF